MHVHMHTGIYVNASYLHTLHQNTLFYTFQPVHNIYSSQTSNVGKAQTFEAEAIGTEHLRCLSI